MYVCRRLRLYSYLIENGFKVEYDRPDIKNPKYTVWIFKDSPELRLAIEKYYSMISN